MKGMFLLIIAFFGSIPASAVVLPGLVDMFGNSVHSEDEVNVQVNAIVQPVPQGYRYTYIVTSMQSSRQKLVQFEVYLPDSFSSVVPGFEGSPWRNSKGDFPNDPSDPPPVGFIYSPEVWSIGWVALYPEFQIQPGGTATGFTFVSPYPPGNVEGYVSGYSNPPVTVEGGSGAPKFYHRTKYGSGKIIPVIGPVKPAVAVGGVTSPYNNVTVQQCAGGLCTVQINATGPMDPYGTAYTYTWSGAFGSVPGAQSVLDLPIGTTPVTLNVSDPYGTVLTTATMDIVVVDPNAALPDDSEHGGSESDDDEEDNDTEDEESDSSEEDNSDDEENDNDD